MRKSHRPARRPRGEAGPGGVIVLDTHTCTIGGRGDQAWRANRSYLNRNSPRLPGVSAAEGLCYAAIGITAGGLQGPGSPLWLVQRAK